MQVQTDTRLRAIEAVNTEKRIETKYFVAVRRLEKLQKQLVSARQAAKASIRAAA